MKDLRVWLIILGLMAILFPTAAMAQDPVLPPPPCCNDSEPPPPDSEGDSITTTLPQVTISDSALSTMGLTRIEFLNQLSAAMFPGRPVTLLVPVFSPSSSSGSPDSADTSSGDYVISGVVPIALDQASAEFTYALGSVLLTDGKGIIVVNFVGETSVPLP